MQWMTPSRSQAQVLCKCRKELIEKLAIKETISELLAVKIPMLQVEDVPGELRVSPSDGQCSLQKSVSSESLNSVDWMNISWTSKG